MREKVVRRRGYSGHTHPYVCSFIYCQQKMMAGVPRVPFDEADPMAGKKKGDVITISADYVNENEWVTLESVELLEAHGINQAMLRGKPTTFLGIPEPGA